MLPVRGVEEVLVRAARVEDQSPELHRVQREKGVLEEELRLHLVLRGRLGGGGGWWGASEDICRTPHLPAAEVESARHRAVKQVFFLSFLSFFLGGGLW